MKTECSKSSFNFLQNSIDFCTFYSHGVHGGGLHPLQPPVLLPAAHSGQRVKFFDCIPHDLLIVKLKAYGFDDYFVHYLYSYLDNRKQCVRINNEKNSLQNIISGVPQGSLVRPTLFNLFFNYFLLFILIVSVHNFTYDISLSNVAKTTDSLKQTLESQFTGCVR